MIRVCQVSEARGRFPLHKPTLAFCQGRGIEIGAAAHNPFGLAGSLNLAPFGSADTLAYLDFAAWRDLQVRMCGAYAVIDCGVSVTALPLASASQDYVVTSHVLEHLHDLVGALREWDRVVRPGGHIVLIWPRRDATPQDARRPLTTVANLLVRHGLGGPCFSRDHLSVLDIPTLHALVGTLALPWTLVFQEERDSKVGNGHCLIYRRDG